MYFDPMKKVLPAIILSLVLICQKNNSISQSLIWAKQLATGSSDMIIDQQGNLLSTGTYGFTTDLDPGPDTFNLATIGAGIYASKLSSSGNLVWAKGIPVSSSGRLYYEPAIATDKQGDVYIVGQFYDTEDFDPGPGVFNMTSAGESDAFLLKLDSSGKFIYAKQFPGSTDDFVHKVTTDASGNIILTFELTGTVDFDPGPGSFNLAGIYNGDVVICKLDPNGNFRWAKQMGGEGEDFVYTSVVDKDGIIYSTGNFTDTEDFDPGPGIFNLVPPGGIFISKIDSSGNFQWAEKMGGGSGVDIQLDPSSNVILTGRCTGGGDYDPGPDTVLLTPTGNTDIFVAKLDKRGKLLWIKQISGPSADQGSSLAIDRRGNIFVAGLFTGTTDFDPGPQVHSLTTNGKTDLFICELTFTGNFVSVSQIGGSLDDEVENILLDQSENIYLYGGFEKTVDFDPGPSVFNLTVPPGPNPSDIVFNTFIAKYGQNNKIEGSIFFDANHNGNKQANENTLANVVVKAERGGLLYFAVSDSVGHYSVRLDTGNYSITPILPAYYSSALPSSHSYNFGSALGSTDSANDFGLQPILNVNDLEVHLTNLSPIRRGFQTVFRLSYFNAGTTSVSGDVTIRLDSSLEYKSSDPSPSTYNDHILTYQFDNLLPGTEKSVDVVLSVPAALSLGSILKSIATVNPIQGDSTPINNTDTLLTTVTGSFDPNDKSVSPSGPITADFVASGQYLDYTIRFQNTGTDSAFNVVVRDTLSDNVDITSFQMISASHPYVLIIEGSTIEWRFTNILMPDSNHNEMLSHGFIRYRVKPKSSLGGGDQVKNKAAIYFDFSNGVITNETNTIVNVVTGTRPIVNPGMAKVFPNPANSILYIKKPGYFDCTLYDVTGKLVFKSEKNYNEAYVNVQPFSNGIYILLIKTDREVLLNKIVVQ